MYYKMLIFLNDLDFHIVEVYRVNEIVLPEAGLGMVLKLADGGFQPDGFAQVEFIAGFLQRMKNLMCSCICTVIADDGIFHQMIVFHQFNPKTKHGCTSLCIVCFLL